MIRQQYDIPANNLIRWVSGCLLLLSVPLACALACGLIFQVVGQPAAAPERRLARLPTDPSTNDFAAAPVSPAAQATPVAGAVGPANTAGGTPAATRPARSQRSRPTPAPPIVSRLIAAAGNVFGEARPTRTFVQIPTLPPPPPPTDTPTATPTTIPSPTYLPPPTMTPTAAGIPVVYPASGAVPVANPAAGAIPVVYPTPGPAPLPIVTPVPSPAVSPTPTLTPLPQYDFMLAEFYNSPTSNNFLMMYVAIVDPREVPIGGMKVVGTRLDHNLTYDSPLSTWHYEGYNAPGEHIKSGNVKFEPPGGIETTKWVVHLEDAHGNRQSDDIPFEVNEDDKQWYFVKLRRRF